MRVEMKDSTEPSIKDPDLVGLKRNGPSRTKMVSSQEHNRLLLIVKIVAVVHRGEEFYKVNTLITRFLSLRQGLRHFHGATFSVPYYEFLQGEILGMEE
jgi:hypothetical protein